MLTVNVAILYDVVVAIPTTANVLPIPYALPPSIILTAVIVPLALMVTFAVAYLPVIEEPNATNLAL